jgi:hypothetical protein
MRTPAAVATAGQRDCGFATNVFSQQHLMFFLNNIYFLLFFFGATAIIYATGKHPLFR